MIIEELNDWPVKPGHASEGVKWGVLAACGWMEDLSYIS